MVTVSIGTDGFDRNSVMNADIERGQSIRIHGFRNRKPYDKTFVIGDTAEYGSYNLSYTGKIVSITEKTVTIEEPYNYNPPRRHRLKLREFSWRNYDFDAAETARRNSEAMYYL